VSSIADELLVMVRIGFERNEPWLKKVFAIAFLSLVDGLEPIGSPPFDTRVCQ